VTRPFRERYAVQVLRDGGIAIDLSTGDVTRLNLTAAAICAALVTTDDPSAVAEDVAARLGTTRENAVRAIESTIAALARPAPRRKPAGAFHYQVAREGDGYDLMFEGTKRLWVSADGRFMRALRDPSMRESQLYEYVRSVAPKLLFLRGAGVVHGAACLTGTGLLAFCGESGAGKTTTVRAFVEAGARPVSEDLLLLASVSPPSIYASGEKAVHAWARSAAVSLSAVPDQDFSTGDLDKVLTGDVLPIDQIWMIAADRRTPSERLLPSRIGATDSLVALMGTLFLGAASADGWRRFLTLTGQIAAGVPVFDTPVPNGIDRLRAAARSYTESSTS
jgi:hypothetical protein